MKMPVWQRWMSNIVRLHCIIVKKSIRFTYKVSFYSFLFFFFYSFQFDQGDWIPLFSFWPVDRNISLSFIPRSDWIGQLQISDPSTIFLCRFACPCLADVDDEAPRIYFTSTGWALPYLRSIMSWTSEQDQLVLFYFEKRKSVRIEKGKLIASKPFVFLSLFESDWISVFSPSFFENKSTDNWFLSLFLFLLFIYLSKKERKIKAPSVKSSWWSMSHPSLLKPFGQVSRVRLVCYWHGNCCLPWKEKGKKTGGGKENREKEDRKLARPLDSTFGRRSVVCPFPSADKFIFFTFCQIYFFCLCGLRVFLVDRCVMRGWSGRAPLDGQDSSPGCL